MVYVKRNIALRIQLLEHLIAEVLLLLEYHLQIIAIPKDQITIYHKKP